MKMTFQYSIALLLLVCALGRAALADNDALAAGLAAERDFVLALTTASDGEDQIGSKDYGRPGGPVIHYYIDMELCTMDKVACARHKTLAVNAAQKFAAAYNDVIGREYIKVTETRPVVVHGSSIPIKILDDATHEVHAGFIVRKGSKSGNWSKMEIRIDFNGYYGSFNNIVAHEMMKSTGFNVTNQRVFSDCLTMKVEGAYRPSQKFELCDVEKRLIVFADKHLQSGMNASQVGYAFDTHWQHSDHTLMVGKRLLKAASRK